MFRFLETIRIKDGTKQLDGYHLRRMKRTLGSVPLPFSVIEFGKILKVPKNLQSGTVKARLLYDSNGYDIGFEAYAKRDIRRLILKDADTLVYDKKYADRSQLITLTNGLLPEEDVLIIKNGLVTDTSYCNVAFTDGAKWYTPNMPLLHGTQRAYLLRKKMIHPRRISVLDISSYSHIRLFNAMIPWDEAIELEVEESIIRM